MASAILIAIGKLFGKKASLPPVPGDSLIVRIDALAEGAGMVCRSRFIERSGKGFVVRDSRTRREIRCRDSGEVLKLLKA